ncbi:hypothetical protein BKA70DRAFT_1560509 [Coprinopsis sp. MPI-PUGE-AT-0042]|nr:hypothetical protein BKA70DRAFT_1560509 [Coprinopsis sp. MPI-PUGE-AT-0042]
MLLELIPPSPTLAPFRLFIDFADLSHGHPNPFAWTSQLSTLLQHELDLPRSMHMLDRAVGRTTLLETVRFDLRNYNNDNAGTAAVGDAVGLAHVRCEFVDGGVLEWAIPVDFTANAPSSSSSSTTGAFLQRIQRILKDVHAMRLEEERAKLAAQYERLQKHRPSPSMSSIGQVPGSAGPSLAKRLSVSVMRHSNSMPSMNAEAPPPKNHKRQRSFLRSLASAVGSIKKMNSSSTLSKSSSLSRSNSTVNVSPLQPTLEHGQTEDDSHDSLLSSSATHDARALMHRERVRAALLDTYRRFVLSSLALPGGSSTSSPSAFLAPIKAGGLDVDDDDESSGSSDNSMSDSDLQSSDEEGEDASSNSSSTPERVQRKRRRATSSDKNSAEKNETYSYYMWVLRSMLRRTEEEMEGIVKDCEETRNRELEVDQLLDTLHGDEVERMRLLRIRQQELELEQFEAEARSAGAFGQAESQLKKSPSKLMKKRSESNLGGGGSAVPVSRFSLGQLIKRKAKQPAVVDSSKPPSRIPRLSSKPSFPPLNSSSQTTVSPLSPPSSIPVVADSDEVIPRRSASSVEDDDAGRFSPTTMEVPSSFSDSDSSDEGHQPGEVEAEDLASHSHRTSTVSSCSSTSGQSDSTESSLTTSTAPTSPSSSPPLPSIACNQSNAAHSDVVTEQVEEQMLLPEAPLQGEDVMQEDGQEIEYGFAVTCDEAVVVGEPSTEVPIFSHPQPLPTKPQTPPRLPVFARPIKPFVLPASYNRLLDLTHKLRSLLIHATLSTQAIKEEEERVLDLLEIRGKRRAWSGGAFVRAVTRVHEQTEAEVAQMRHQVLFRAKERADEKKGELKAKLREERRAERRYRRKREANEDSDDEIPSPGVTLVNTNRKLPPLPFFALSVPATSSPLANFCYTAEDKENEGLTYVAPVKERTVFYTWSKGRSGFELNGPLPSPRRSRLSVDGLERSIMSSREMKARKNHRMGFEDGFVEFDGGMVDENGFIYVDGFAQLHDAERSAHGFPLLEPLDEDDDDGIEWQRPCQDYPISPPLSPTSMDAIIPPRPRLLPTVNHPSHRFPLNEDEESDDEETSPLSFASKLPGSGDSTPAQSDDDDEFEFDRFRRTTPLFEEEEELGSPVDEDDDEDFYADITHITHFVDGIDRKTKERPPRKVGASESSVYHRQRKRTRDETTPALRLLSLPVEEQPEESLGRGLPESPSKLNGLHRSAQASSRSGQEDRTRSMYKRLSPISPSNPSPNPSYPSAESLKLPYVPYGRVEFGSSAVAPLGQESLLCQPIRFNHLPAILAGSEDSLKPTVKLVTKTLAASPPPAHPSPPVFSLSTPRLRISVQSKEAEMVGLPDVPRSPSPPLSRSPSPPPTRPLSPALSLDGSVLSAQSSIGPITPIDDICNPLDPAPFDEATPLDGGASEEVHTRNGRS